MPVKSHRFVESVSYFVFSSCQQHDFVAVHFPGVGKGVLENGLTIASSSEASMGHHVLDNAVRAAASGQIGDNRQQA